MVLVPSGFDYEGDGRNDRKEDLAVDLACLSGEEIRNALIGQLAACGLSHGRIAEVFSKRISRPAVSAILKQLKAIAVNNR